MEFTFQVVLTLKGESLMQRSWHKLQSCIGLDWSISQSVLENLVMMLTVWGKYRGYCTVQ